LQPVMRANQSNGFSQIAVVLSTTEVESQWFVFDV